MNTCDFFNLPSCISAAYINVNVGYNLITLLFHVLSHEKNIASANATTATRPTNQLSQEDFMFSYDVQVTFIRQKKRNKRDAKTSLHDHVYCYRLVQSGVDTGPDLECAETGFEGDSNNHGIS